MRYILIILLTLCAHSLSADEYRPAYLELKQTEEKTFDVLWKVPAKGRSRLDIHLELPTGSIFTNPPHSYFIRGAFIEQSRIYHADSLVGGNITIGGLDRVPTDVLVRIERLDNSSETARLHANSPSYKIKGNPGFWDVIGSYLAFGFEHILEGLDHLLFVACLIFIARTWRRILITVTGFTIAHSITLSLASLDLVRLPLPPVEAVIALSIVFLAREITLNKKNTLTWRHPVSVSVIFGLLHGFGFASALGDIGLPQTEIPAALVAFNLGVELGQIVFVVVLVLLFWLWAYLKRFAKQSVIPMIHGRTKVHHTNDIYKRNSNWAPGHGLTVPDDLFKIKNIIGLGVGGIAMFWTIERIVGFWI